MYYIECYIFQRYSSELINAKEALVLNLHRTHHLIFVLDQWKYPFERNKENVFHCIDGDKKIKFMYQSKINNASFVHDKKNKIKVLSLPYTDEDISMIFYLPTEIKSNVKKLTILLQKINLEKLRSQPVQPVMIPKFTMEFRIDELKKIMETMGARNMWSSSANFNGKDSYQ